MTKVKLSCQIMEQAALFSETFRTRDGEQKRRMRVRTPKWRRQARKPSAVTRIDCQNLDIVL